MRPCRNLRRCVIGSPGQAIPRAQRLRRRCVRHATNGLPVHSGTSPALSNQMTLTLKTHSSAACQWQCYNPLATPKLPSMVACPV